MPEEVKAEAVESVGGMEPVAVKDEGAVAKEVDESKLNNLNLFEPFIWESEIKKGIPLIFQ